MKNAIFSAALVAMLGLSAAGIAVAQSAPAGQHVLRWPVPGLRAASAHGRTQLSPAQREGVWQAFFARLGGATPAPWSAGFALAGVGLTSIPSAPYPALSVAGLTLTGNEFTNVDGLASLKTVSGLMTISFNDRLANVDGLANLTSVGGDLRLQFDRLTNVNGLADLTSVGESLSLWDNQLTNVDGLAHLASVGGELDLRGNPGLGDLSGLRNVRSLGDVIMIDAGVSVSVPIPADAWLCQPAQAGKFTRMTQAEACGQQQQP